jgi:hypothetical protein
VEPVQEEVAGLVQDSAITGPLAELPLVVLVVHPSKATQVSVDLAAVVQHSTAAVAVAVTLAVAVDFTQSAVVAQARSTPDPAKPMSQVTTPAMVASPSLGNSPKPNN